MSAVILLTACKSTQPYTFDLINLGMSTIEVKEALGEPSLELPMTSGEGPDISLINYEKQTFFGDYFVLSASLINFADVKNTIQILK